MIIADGWDDGGPRGVLHDMGGTADLASVPLLLAAAELALAENGWAGRAWVTDAEGELVSRRDVAAMAEAN